MLGLLFFACSEQDINLIDEKAYADGPLIAVDPKMLDYGLVAEPTTQTFTVTSIGNEDLEVSEISFIGPNDMVMNFALIEADDAAFSLAPQESRDIEVLFTPLIEGNIQAQAIVKSNDGFDPNTVVDLIAEGPVRDLKITPNPLDFGDIYVGCEREQIVTIENVGNDAVSLLSLQVEGESFSILTNPLDTDNNPATPESVVLAPGESTTVGIGYRPLEQVDHAATLTVLADDNIGIHTALQEGTGVYSDYVEQTWENGLSNQTDILFAIDHSCSMSDDAGAVASNFSSFLTQLSNLSANWQIMVAFNGCNLGGILTPNTSGYAAIAQNAISCGGNFFFQCAFGGDDNEESLLTAAMLAIENTDANECNAGFIREEALLHIILVSDEPEQSQQPWQDIVQTIINKKGNPGDVRISSIAGDIPNGCEAGGNSADAGTGYWEASNYTNGLFLSICSAWADPANVAMLAETSVVLDTYSLDSEPVEETIRVFVNGAEPSNNNWHYDESTQSIIFDVSPPGEGSEVTVTYVPYIECD